MKYPISRRTALIALSAGLALGGLPSAMAQTTFPDRPLKMIVGFAPGGLTDSIGRIIAEGLREQLGQTVVVENRPGAAGNLSAGIVAAAPADGLTLYLGAVGLTTTLAVNPTAVKADPITGLSHIGAIAYTPNVVVVGPSVDSKDVKELVEKSKVGSGFTFASSGIGGGLHLTGEMFGVLTGAKLTHVPYRGSAPAVADLLGGRVDMQFDNVSGALALIRDNKVRALAVTSTQRIKELPDVPTMAELGFPGMEVGAWFGLMAPPGVPEPVIARLATALNAVLDQKSVQDYFERVGLTSLKTAAPAEFTEYLKRDAALWAKVVKATGVTIAP